MALIRCLTVATIDIDVDRLWDVMGNRVESCGKNQERGPKRRADQTKVSHHANLEMNLYRDHKIKAFYDLGH